MFRVYLGLLLLLGWDLRGVADDNCSNPSGLESCEITSPGLREPAEAPPAFRVLGKVKSIRCGGQRDGLQEYRAQVEVQKELIGKVGRAFSVAFLQDPQDRGAMPGVREGEISELDLGREGDYILEASKPVVRSTKNLPLCPP